MDDSDVFENSLDTPLLPPDSHQCLPSIFKKGNISSILNGNRKPELLIQVTEAEDISVLERKMFKSEKVNLKDILGKRKSLETLPVPVLENIPEIYLLSSESNFDNNTQLNREFNMNKQFMVTLKITNKIDTAKKRKISPKEFLRPKQYNVTLKVDKEALAFFKKFENPLYSSNNTQFKKRDSLKVTLNISKEYSRVIHQTLMETAPKKLGNSIFDDMMKSAASDVTKLTPLQRIKQLPPPTIPKESFHVFDAINDETYIQKCLNHLNLRPHMSTHTFHDPFVHIMEPEAQENGVVVVNKDISNLELLFKSRCDVQDPVFNHLYNMLHTTNDNLLMWPTLFAPTTNQSLLLLDNNKRKLEDWINTCFDQLKTEIFKGPRKLKLKRKKDEFNNFVVDDHEDDDDNNKDTFIPFLIIHGRTGTGKSASVYSTMKELDGYVYEINASQQRSRRYISSILKELCTTQLIHKQNEEGEFQKGIILLEDCDILFEQDRTFWTIVQEILEVSRRPIILTCSDFQVIPKSMYDYAVDRDIILDYDVDRLKDITLYKNYLWACCLTQGYDINDDVLNCIVRQSDYTDVRRGLLECQYLCQGKTNSAFAEVKFKSPNISQSDDYCLDEVRRALDLFSVADTIETQSWSQIEHGRLKNEFIDIYYLDETTKLKQPLLPYEPSTAHFIWKSVEEIYGEPITSQSHLTFNDLRTCINEFVGSRSKPLPAYLKGLKYTRPAPRNTRSNVDSKDSFWNLDITGIPENSLAVYLSPKPYIAEFAPFARYWNGLQLALDNVEKTNYNQQLSNGTGNNLKAFLEWREFQDKSNKVLNTIPKLK